MKNHQTYNHETLWEAFRYVSGELPDAESRAFEDQMLSDVGLCEAVAEATRLTSVVASLAHAARPPQSPSVTVSATQPAEPSDERLTRFRSIATLVSISCCLALAVMLFAPKTPDQPTAVAANEITEAEELVNAWVGSSDADLIADAVPPEAVDAELDVPAWMLAAVSLSELEDLDGAENERPEGLPADQEWF